MIIQGPCAIWDIRSKSRLHITTVADAQSFRNVAQGTAVMLSCSMQNYMTIELLKQILCKNAILRNLSFRYFSGRISYIAQNTTLPPQ